MSDGDPGDNEPKHPPLQQFARVELIRQSVVTEPLEAPPSVVGRLNVAIGSALITASHLPKSREAALVTTKLDEALLWLGRVRE